MKDNQEVKFKSCFVFIYIATVTTKGTCKCLQQTVTLVIKFIVAYLYLKLVVHMNTVEDYNTSNPLFLNSIQI